MARSYEFYVGVGSNKNAETNILAALVALAGSVELLAVSTFYRNPAYDDPGFPPYVNGVVKGRTKLGPEDLKRQVLSAVETSLGRHASDGTPIDLDLLFYTDWPDATHGLSLPHPLVTTRPYMAIPFAEITGNITLPGCDDSMASIAARYRRASLTPMPELTAKLRTLVNPHG